MTGAVDWFAWFVGGEKGANYDCERIAAFSSFADYAANKAAYKQIYAPFCNEATENKAKTLFLPSLDLPDKALDSVIEYSLENDTRLAVICNRTLTEAGVIDSRFGKSPVMLLHEFGLLEKCTVLSGIYLDKDDLSLMAQECVPLVVFPSSDAGSGYGIAPVCAAINCGVKVRIGSGDGAYNPSRSPIKEGALLRLLVSANMNKRDAVSLYDIAKMCAAENALEPIIRKIADEITKI